MKKLVAILLVVLMVLTLGACDSKEDSKEETVPNEETKETAIKVGFVSDVGGIDDKSFNQTTWEGIKKYAEEAALPEDNSRFVESVKADDYIPNITSFADEAYDLIVCAGYMFDSSIAAVADNYPEQKMLVIDVNWLDATKYPNVKQVGFNVEQGSYLVGVAAGLKANELGKHHVGMIIGGEGASMDPFYAGYQQGVWAACPDCVIDYWCANNDYNNPEAGKAQAKIMFDSGAVVIFGCAGNTGNGVITEAAERQAAGEEVWAIGVDTDQYWLGYYDEAKTKSAVLTSMMKRVDTAAYDAAKAVAEGTFAGGVYTYDLSNGGVGVPPTNPNLSDEVLAQIADYSSKIVKGELEVAKSGVYGDTDSRVNGNYGVTK